MYITVNEKKHALDRAYSLYELKDKYKSDADVHIVNGHLIKQDMLIKEGDHIVFIKKGEKPSLNDMEHLLIARHTPHIHKEIKKAVVGVAGLGGLGSNIASALTRIGIGKLILCDFDVVEPSNLNRQNYYIHQIGMKKVEATINNLKNINPFVKLVGYDTYLDSNNIGHIFKDVDIVVEAFDSPDCKAGLVNYVLQHMGHIKIVAASGMAGYFTSNSIVTKKVNDRLYVCGDGVSEAKQGCGLMAPRVGVAAHHQANMVLRLILGEEE